MCSPHPAPPCGTRAALPHPRRPATSRAALSRPACAMARPARCPGKPRPASRAARHVPETGLRARPHHQHHGSYALDQPERHETPDPVRPDAVNSRFHGVRQQADRMINMSETALSSFSSMNAASMQYGHVTDSDTGAEAAPVLLRATPRLRHARQRQTPTTRTRNPRRMRTPRRPGRRVTAVGQEQGRPVTGTDRQCGGTRDRPGPVPTSAGRHLAQADFAAYWLPRAWWGRCALWDRRPGFAVP
jgi:hypothetical protein